ncbi:MAG: DNA primase [Burkholderiales bacterium]|nr:DNA primase [Burkholderiales bacterium]
MQIPQSSIDEVVARSDIVDVVSKHIKVKRSGQNYFACCPFHNEKSASFSISPSKQIYHCFGCGESGNSISFVMKFLGLDFISAVKSLASQYGVLLPEEDSTPYSKEIVKQKKQRKLDLDQVMQNSLQFYRKQLANSSYARHYLENRGLTSNIINQFELGFAPNNFQNLQQVFSDYTTNKFMLDSGLTLDSENGKRYDRFRDRIIFPIKNIQGNIIGFGGRILVKGEPKYLNSPETELFSKSKELYGLYEAKKTIRDESQSIVVEGYMDVIALHQYGVSNAVATMGTAATEEHIKQLFRLSDNICYAFDGDNAGKKAAWRALERSISLITDIKSVSFLFLPDEHDPDSYIRQYGVDNFKEKTKTSSVGVITFLLNQLSTQVNLQQDEGKARFISLVKPYLEQIKAAALQVILKKQLANMVDLDPNAVESILNNRSRFAFYNKSLKNIQNNYNSNIKRAPLNVSLMNAIVLSLFNNPKLAREFPVPSIEVLLTLDEDVTRLFQLIDYLENYCDSFEDINMPDVILSISFQHINLNAVYQKVSLERTNYTSVFALSIEDYQNNLRDLIIGKKRKPMPKLV